METISFILATVFMVEDSPSENGSPTAHLGVKQGEVS